MHWHRFLGLKFHSLYLSAHGLLPLSRDSFTFWKIRKLSSSHSPQAMPQRQHPNKDLGCEDYMQSKGAESHGGSLPPRDHRSPEHVVRWEEKEPLPMHTQVHARARTRRLPHVGETSLY